MAFAQSEIILGERQGDGLPLREHLESAYRQTGIPHDLLVNAPELPVGTADLWADFLALHSTRGSGMGGQECITWPALDAYQRINGVRFEPWQIEALRRADNAYLANKAEKVAK